MRRWLRATWSSAYHPRFHALLDIVIAIARAMDRELKLAARIGEIENSASKRRSLYVDSMVD